MNIHVNSSCDWPTPEAKNTYRPQTTGEREHLQAALHFYARASGLRYAIIFKVGEELGHASSSQIEEIAQRFFDYALAIKAKHEEPVARADCIPGYQAKLPDLYTLSGLDRAPYYADLITKHKAAKSELPCGKVYYARPNLT